MDVGVTSNLENGIDAPVQAINKRRFFSRPEIAHLVYSESRTKAKQQITEAQQTDNCSVSSVEVAGPNDLKFMDDSASSSSSLSTSSLSTSVDGACDVHIMSPSPTLKSGSCPKILLDRNDSSTPPSSGVFDGSDDSIMLNNAENSKGPSTPKPSRIPVPTRFSGSVRPVSLSPRMPCCTAASSIASLREPESEATSHVNSEPSLSQKFAESCESVASNRSSSSEPHPEPPNQSSEHTNEYRYFLLGNTYPGSDSLADNSSRLRELLLARLSDSESDSESIAESIYHQPPKAADRGAASRLAKRLFNLDGFRITDVAKHLCKRNDFSQLVGEEFAGLFDFSDQRLDMALRSFLNTFSLTGETQERERILLHFSRRYLVCNPGAYLNEDVCHTLVCALMLLNTDLHNPAITRKMSCPEFIQNLTQMHCGEYYDRDQLKTLYNAIKQEPIRWPQADINMMNFVNFYYPGGPNMFTPTGASMPPGFMPTHPAYLPPAPMIFGPNMPFGCGTPLIPCATFPGPQQQQQHHPSGVLYGPNGYGTPYWNNYGLPSGYNVPNSVSQPNAVSNGSSNVTDSVKNDGRRFTGTLSTDLVPDVNAREYMRGFLVRKWVMESRGKKASLGRRGWKVYYARLRDLVLYLYKNAVVANAATRAEELHQLYLQHQQQHQRYMSQLAAIQRHQQLNSQNDSYGNEEEHEREQSLSNDDSDELVTNADSTTKPTETTDAPSTAPSTSANEPQFFIPPTMALPPPAFTPPPIPSAETVIRIAHAFASRASDYVKKSNVFRLRTREGAEYLFEVTDPKELDMWIERINFVAALLSAPIGLTDSERGPQCSRVSVLCTKLNIREQLEEHQNRLIELGRELADLRKTASAAADVRSLKSRSLSSRSIERRTLNDLTTSIADAKKSSSDVDVPADPTDEGSQSNVPNAPTEVSSSSHATSSFISVFSTASLGRRRKSSSGSLSTSNSDCMSVMTMNSKQRAELEERIQFTEFEIHRYKTYARLLEAELFRIQQHQASMINAHAAAFNQYGTVPYGSAYVPPPQYAAAVSRDSASQFVPLAVLGQNVSSAGETPERDADSAPASVCDTATTTSAPVYSTLPPPLALPGKMNFSYYSPATPYSPSVSGRVFSRQWRGGSQQFRQLQVLGPVANRTSGGRLLNGHRLAEEEPVDSSGVDTNSEDADPAAPTAMTSSSSTEKFPTTLVQPSEGVFYEII